MTVLRFFVMYILGLVIFLFLLNLLNLIKESRIYQKIFTLTVLLSFIALGFLSIEKYIAQYNISRAHDGYYDTDYILRMSNDALDQKVQALADQRRIVAENLRNMSSSTVIPPESVLGEVAPSLPSTEPVTEVVPASRDIPLYYWNLSALRVTEYLKKHPEERSFFL